MSNATISTWGYHAVEGAKLFMLQIGEALPQGWHDSPANLPLIEGRPAGNAPAAAAPAISAVARTEFEALSEQVDDLRKSLHGAVDHAVKAAVDEAVTPLREQLHAIGEFARELAGGEKREPAVEPEPPQATEVPA